MSVTEITPRAYFGLRVNIKQNAHFITDSQILYPAGSVLVLHDYYEQRQMFIELQEKSLVLELIIVSPSRKLAAIIENGEKGQILIFDMQKLKKRRTLNLPPDSATNRFESICFSHDDKYIMAITGEPDWMLVAYNWEKGKIETTAKANYPNSPATVTQVYCSPTDNCEICLIGPGLFRLLNMSETVWRQYGFQKAEQITATTAAWLTSERVLCGTADGRLLLIEAGELKFIYDALSVVLINVKERDESSSSATSLAIARNSSAFQEEDKQVRTLISFSKGFAYSCKTGYVHMFEKESIHKYRKRNVFRIDDPDFREFQKFELNTVMHLSINASQDKLLASTNRAQLYSVRLWGPDLYVAPEIPFKHLGESLHHGPIIGLAMCVWKPIFMTCGEIDRTVRVWNYDTETLEMVKQYEEDVFSVALHPTGLFATIGFTEKLRFMIVLLDDIQMCREFPIKECKLSSFSAHGHYFAATNQSTIHIYSCVSFQNVWILKGHSGRITGLQWTLDDKKLVSCGTDGFIYEWDVITGKKVHEIVTPGVQYWDISITSDGRFIYAVGDDGVLKEINNSTVIRAVEMNQSNMDHIVVSRSDLMMFVCGDKGSVISVRMPLTEPTEFKPFFYHNSEIMQMKLSMNDETLVTVSVGGSLIIWKLLYAEGKTIVMDKDFTYSNDILISKTELEEKILTINDLSQKLNELEQDHNNQMKETDSAYSEKIRDIHDSYCQAIEELKEKTEQLEIDHSAQLTTINEEVNEMKEKQAKEKKEVDANYTGKLLVEYDKFKLLDEQKEEMVSDYEIRLAELQKSKEEATENITKVFEEKLMDINQKLEESYAQNKKNIKQHEVVKQQFEDDTDREIVETKAKYENVLREERENNVKLRAEASSMRKKYLAAQKDIDEFRQQIMLLQTEHQKYQSVIQSLEKDIVDLKREIIERDLTVQDKDKRIYDLKKKIQELEKYKFVLDYKIKELNNQIEPKDREIKEKKEQIEDMEKELENLQKINTSLELQLIELKEKIMATEKEVESYEEKHLSGSNVFRQIKVDVYTLYHQLNDFKKLKDGIKIMYHKYNEDQVFIRGQSTDTDLQREFMTQREFLEKTISAMRSTLEKSKEYIKHDGSKVLQDNVILLEELNQVRKAYKETVWKVRNLEELLEFKPGKSITPREAYNKLQQSLKKQENMVEEYQTVIDKADLATGFLNEEIIRLQDKITQLQEREKTDDEN